MSSTTSRIPRLPEIPLSQRKMSNGAKNNGLTPRGADGSSSSSSRPSPRLLQLATNTGSTLSSPILLNSDGEPIIITSKSKTRYMLAHAPPPSPRDGTTNIPPNASKHPITSNRFADSTKINSARGMREGNQTPRADDPDVELKRAGAEGGSSSARLTGGNVNGSGEDLGSSARGAAMTLSRNDMRGIENIVTFNSKLRHNHRQHNVATVIPSLSFAVRVKGPSDSVLGLQVAPIDPQESALDIVLRLTSPEELRIPALKDMRSSIPLSSRLVTLLKGSTSMAMHWEGEREGLAKDHSHIQALKDAKMRIEAAKRQENHLGEAKARCCLAALHYNTHNMEGAIRALSPAVALFELCGHAAGLAFALNTLGAAHFHNGEYKMALVYFRKQESLCGDYGKAVARINLGVCYAALEEPHFSQQAFADALESAKGSGEPVLETIAIGNKGLAYMRLGNMREAQQSLEECLEHCTRGTDHVGTTVVLLLLGQNSAACRDFKQATFYYEHAMRIAEQTQCTPLLAMAKVSVGVCRGQAESEGQVLATATNMGKPLSLADIVTTLAIKDKD